MTTATLETQQKEKAMDMDDEDGEKMGPDSQTITDAVRRAVADSAVASYFSVDRLLAAMRPIEMCEALRDGITSDFTALGRPVPWDAPWHLANVQLDGEHDGTWRISTMPDLVLPGYVIALVSDQDRYAAAQQNYRDLATKKLQQAPRN